MPDTRIADLFQVQTQFTRSIHLERDFHDLSTVKGYVVTAQAQSAMNRLASGLAPDSNCRAWRITGDYGSGKSSLALALAHLLSADRRGLPAAIRKAVDFRKLSTRRPRLLPVLVTGSRAPAGPAVARSLAASLEGGRRGGKRARVIKKAIRLADPDPQVAAGGREVIGLIEEANAYVRSSGKGDGLLLVLDELGKFLEFAALHPDRQDIHFLQELAESAARSAGHPFSVLGLLHQGFSAYAAQLSLTSQREWEKVAGRYEEIVFSHPVEQMATLVAEALNVRTRRLPQGLPKCLREEMAIALGMNWYGASAPTRALTDYAPRIYPLHPTVLPVLVRFFSRFGQNERSLFSFMFSGEPFGLREFAAQAASREGIYRIHHLYDYARANLGQTLRSQSYRSHWNLIESLVDSFPVDSEIELQVLKTVAVLNLLDTGALLASDEALELAVTGSTLAQRGRVQDAIAHLQKRRQVLHKRGAAGSYRLWPHTSVNLEKAYDEAGDALGDLDRVSSHILDQLETRPIVARRHYIESGNLRHFEVRHLTVREFQGLAPEENLDADGLILVPLCDTAEERQAALAHAQRDVWAVRPDVLVAVPRRLSALGGLVEECRRWQWISDSLPELSHDSYAQEEVSRQIRMSRQVLETRLRSFVGLREFTLETELQWFRQGAKLGVRDGRELLSQLSEICEEMYSEAPSVHNELLNRHALSSAAAAARMRLIERMLEASHLSLLGMDETKKPPEMSMYLSVLRRAGLHREIDGQHAIAEPSSDDDPCNVRPSLNRILEILHANEGTRVKVSDIFDALRQPPYGVRDGLSPVLLAVFAITHEHEVAFYEDGAFLRSVVGHNFQAMLKSPESFEVQYCKIGGVRALLFEELVKSLRLQRTNSDKPNVLDVIRPLCVFAANLPPFAHNTKTLSPEALSVRRALTTAQEPAALLFRDLPTACGMRPFGGHGKPSQNRVRDFVRRLRKAIDEIRAVYPEMLAQMREAIALAFDRPGAFEQVRPALAGTAKKLVLGVKEPGLKAFCLRVADAALDEQEWLESLGSLLCSKPPSKWHDGDAVRFMDELHRMADRFRNIESMALGAQPSEGGSAVRVSIAFPDGTDVDQVLHVNPDEEPQVRRVQADISDILQQHGRIGIVAMSRAMSKTLGLANHDEDTQ